MQEDAPVKPKMKMGRSEPRATRAGCASCEAVPGSGGRGTQPLAFVVVLAAAALPCLVRRRRRHQI
jgi:hypothetical protein